MENWDLTFKIIIVGDSGVGKSSLLYRFVDNVYYGSHKATIGVDFKIRSIPVDDQTVKLQIWDTAGQDRFLAITTSYYRGAQGVLVVYDVTNETSFRNVTKWMGEIEKHGRSSVNVVLVGNKSDMETQRAVSTDEAKELAESLGLSFLETSAKSAENVEEVFKIMASEIKVQVAPRPVQRNRPSRILLETRCVSHDDSKKKKSTKKDDKQCCGS